MPFLLNVEVVRCTDIASHERTPPDPYCQLGLLDLAGREVKNEKKRTSKKNRTYSPVFNETLSFGETIGLFFDLIWWLFGAEHPQLTRVLFLCLDLWVGWCV